MFLLWLRQLSQNGDQTPGSVLPPAEGRSSPTSTPVFSTSSFILPSFAQFYIVISTGQVLLSAPSWCSAYTSVSEGVFLMYPWREMYSTSSYSSAILFSSDFLVNIFFPEHTIIKPGSQCYPSEWTFYYLFDYFKWKLDVCIPNICLEKASQDRFHSQGRRVR